MKKTFLCMAMLLFAAAGFAQTADNTAPGEKNEWLPSFNRVVVSGDFDITFVRVPETEAPKITYDTRGSYTTKFKAEVKDKVLHITERSDSRRPEHTKVVVRYNSLTNISVSDAAATFDGTLTGTLVDLTLGGDATVTAAIDIKDLKIDLSGRATATLSGKVRYFELLASSGTVDASTVEAMSVRANASNGASVSLWVTDRLEATTSMKGFITYKGTPEIIRGGSKFMGGEINPVSEK